MKNPLENITPTTRNLTYKLQEKHSEYRIGVNGKGQIVLAKNYTNIIATGTNRDIQKVIKELLK